MILEERQAGLLPAEFAMVDGCFDPIHRGHVEYFRLAAGLGVAVVCNLACDAYILANKGRPPLLPEADRAAVLAAMRDVAHVFLCRRGTAWSLRHLRPRFYVKGADWAGRLPPDQIDICNELGIEIIYVNCPLNSSTRIIEDFLEKRRVYPAIRRDSA
jgi:glycerol-3-phosphate cytidylyltransferase